jgi:hypothetical protein
MELHLSSSNFDKNPFLSLVEVERPPAFHLKIQTLQ